MSEQSDVILTPNSHDDDFLKRALDRHLWGYPKLVDACPFSVLADVRRKNLEDSLVTRPGFSFKEPRRAASAGLVRKVKIYHSSIDLLVLDGFGGARWRNNSIPQ